MMLTIPPEIEVQMRHVAANRSKDWVAVILRLGEDPRTFFIDGYWAEADFTTSDMRGVSWEGAIIDGARFRPGDLPEAERKKAKSAKNIKFSDPSDAPASLSESPQLRDFLTQLEREIGNYRSTGKMNWNPLTISAKSLPDYTTRVKATRAILDAGPISPTRKTLRALAVDVPIKAARPNTFDKRDALADVLLRLFIDSDISHLLQDIDATVDVIGAIDPRLEHHIGTKLDNLTKLKTTIDYFRQFGWQTTNHLFEPFLARKIKFAEGVQLVALMKTANVAPDIAVFSTLAGTAESADECDTLLGLMNESAITPNSAILKKLATRSSAFGGIRRLVDVLRASKIEPDTSLLNALIGVAQNFDECLSFLEEFSALNLEPNASTFNNMARAAANFSDFERLIKATGSTGHAPTITMFSLFAKNLDGFENRLRVLRLLDESGLVPDAAIFQVIAKATDDFEEMGRLFSYMRELGVKPQAATVKKYVTMSDSFRQARKALETIQLAGAMPDVSTFDLLIRAGQTLDERLEGLEIMIRMGAVPDSRIYSGLVGISADLGETEPYLSMIDKLGGRPERQDVEDLLENADDKEAWEIYNLMTRYGHEARLRTINIMVKKIPDYDDAWRFIRAHESREMSFDHFTLNPMLRKAGSVQQIHETLDAMSRNSITPDGHSVKALFFAAIPESALVEGIRRMIRLGLQTQDVTAELLEHFSNRFRDILHQINEPGNSDRVSQRTPDGADQEVSQIEPKVSAHLILLLDNSASMAGRSSADLNEALRALVASLRTNSKERAPDFRMSVVSFGSDVTTLVQAKSIAHIEVERVAVFGGDGGSTNATEALNEAFRIIQATSRDDTDLPAYVFFVSDGHPNDPGSAMLAAQRLKKLDLPAGLPRLASIGLAGADDDFMRNIATSPEHYKNLTASRDLVALLPSMGAIVITAVDAAEVEEALIRL